MKARPYELILLALLVVVIVFVSTAAGAETSLTTDEAPDRARRALTPRIGEKDVAKKDTLGFSSGKQAQTTTPTDMPLGRYAWSLLFVCVVMGGSLYLLKRVQGSFDGTGAHRAIEVLARTPLDAKNLVALVRVHSEEVLLGYGPNGVTFLKNCTGSETCSDASESTDVVSDGCADALGKRSGAETGRGAKT